MNTWWIDVEHEGNEGEKNKNLKLYYNKKKNWKKKKLEKKINNFAF